MNVMSVSCVLSDSAQKERPCHSLFSHKLTKTDFLPQLLPFISPFLQERDSLPFNHQGKQSAWSKWTVSLPPNLPHLFNNTDALSALWKYTTSSSHTPFTIILIHPVSTFIILISTAPLPNFFPISF